MHRNSSLARPGLLQRNYEISKSLLIFYSLQKLTHLRHLDFGGGYGVLVRLMRDLGLDFYWKDPYCENLFAKHFEHLDSTKKYSSIAFFEVLEHVPDPLVFFKELFTNFKFEYLIFTTELHQGKPPPISWRYYSFHTGQHISFFSAKTLGHIAQEFGYVVTSYKNTHIISKFKISPLKMFFSFSKLRHLLFPLIKLNIKSKLDSDYERITS